MSVAIPQLSLVVLIGVSGSGKSTFARAHFLDAEVLSSDACRALVANDPDDQAATRDAFDVLRYIAAKRLQRKLLTVVDATNVQGDARKPLVDLAREYHVLPVAIVFNLSLAVCKARNRERTDRTLPDRVLERQHDQLRRSLRGLKREGFRYVHVLDSPEAVAAVSIERTRPWTDRTDEHGPFDLVGDVHGCFDELVGLLRRLGYTIDLGTRGNRHRARHPDARRVVFLGDLVDRGPNTPDVLRLAMGMVEDGTALVVPGNHEDKLKRALQGREVNVSHGLRESLEQLGAQPQPFRQEIVAFLDSLVSHYVLDGGRLVVAHAGMRENLAGRASAKVRDFALYGETTGETDQFGVPVRYRWADDYRGAATVVYGHTPVAQPQWLNNTICVDTGCVFGGRLTALRWPEKELVSVPARRTYYEPVRPLAADVPDDDRPLQHRHEDLLDLGDVLGKRQVATGLMGAVTVREEQASTALETASRFTVDPKWMIYLPPTMPPAGTTSDGADLERPELAWEFYRGHGVQRLVCEEKHMGSRAVIVVGRDGAATRDRFGVTDGRDGVVYTRTGRPFFDDPARERELVVRVRAAAKSAGLWEELASNWLCLDAEIMPWNVKAEELIREHFAAVGAAGKISLRRAGQVLAEVARRTPDAAAVGDRLARREDALRGFVAAYQPYCWTVDSLDDVRVAGFHLLASEGQVHDERDHLWHMDVLGRLADADGEVIRRTNFVAVDLDDPDTVAAATRWWEELTAGGGEGMVVKPQDFTFRGRRGLAQPAVKVRGREYLRVVYGPEYTLHLDRVRERHLGRKRSLALREFALGLEALHRFVAREPLRRVHEAVFAILALESEPVDPRL